jgi:hypothetical protein
VRYHDSVTRITLIISHFLNLNTIPITGLILRLAAVSLFLIGHRVEGNFRAMTLIVLFKYLRSKKLYCRMMRDDRLRRFFANDKIL